MVGILAMATQQQGQQGQQGNPWASLIPLILLLVVFYVFIILPQSKRQKKHMEMLKSLKKGDKIVTAGGIIGTVVGVDDEKVVIKTGEGTKIEVSKGYVSQKLEG